MIPSRYISSVAQLAIELAQLQQMPEVLSAILLIADDEHPQPEELDPILASFSKKIIGGVFPEIIFESERKSKGMVLIPQKFALQTQIIDLALDEATILESLTTYLPQLDEQDNHLFLFVDAFAEKKEEFIDGIFNCFGNTATVLGGGAGSLSFQPFPCVLSNQGLRQNAAVLGLAHIKASIGVAHGWKPISKPMKVTEAIDNKVVSIDWRPAFEVYREIVEMHSGRIFDDNNFFDIAKSYPFGMLKLDEEHVIRDPFMVEENTMLIVDVVAQGQFVSVMHGDEPSLIEAARKARQTVEAKLQQEGSKQYSFFCIDCISRVLFMQEDFSKEIAILRGDTTVNGALTIGEIANSGESFLEIFNKTVVLAKWEITT